MPREWPPHSVIAQVTRKSASASQENVSAPPTMAAVVMPVSHSDFTGDHRTRPKRGSAASASTRWTPKFACRSGGDAEAMVMERLLSLGSSGLALALQAGPAAVPRFAQQTP